MIDLAYQILLGLIGGADVYGGIRSDLRFMHERIAEASGQAEKANERISNHVEHFHTDR